MGLYLQNNEEIEFWKKIAEFFFHSFHFYFPFWDFPKMEKSQNIFSISFWKRIG